jgi:CHC2 zinc finger
MPVSAAWEEWFRSVRERARSGLADLVREDAPMHWQSAGRGQYKCCSPLKAPSADRSYTPSFFVYADGSWHDYGQGIGGDAIAYVQQRDRCGFMEAVNTLASRFGLETWQKTEGTRGRIVDPEALVAEYALEEKRRRIFEVLTSVVGICHAMLPESIRSYLHERGFPDSFLNEQRIGWVPMGLYEICRDSLPDVTKEELLSTGFFKVVGDTTYPVAGHRILMPYWRNGLVEYAIGREYYFGIPKNQLALEKWDIEHKFKKQATHHEEKRPYVSPHLLHDLFWGEDCLEYSGKEQTLLITEGIADAYTLKYLGFHILSPVTIRPSNKQLIRLLELAKNWKEVVILNDREPNRAGTKGALATAEALWGAGIRVRLGRLPLTSDKKVDVNEIGARSLSDAKAEGLDELQAIARTKELFQGIVDEALVYPEFLVEDTPEDLSFTELEARLALVGKAAQRLSALPRADLMARMQARFPKLPKKDAKKVIDTAIAAEELRQKNLAKAAVVTAQAKDAEAHQRAFDPGASAKLRGAVIEQLDCYEREKDGERERISTFALVLKKVVAATEPGSPDLLVCRVVGPGPSTLYDDWVIPSLAWTSTRKFRESLPSPLMQWCGDDNELQSVLDHTVRIGLDKVPRVTSTSILGYHTTKDGPRFVLPDGTYNEKGERAEDLVYLRSGHSSLSYRLATGSVRIDDTTKELARQTLSSLGNLHDERVIWPLAAWFAVAPFKPRLKTHKLELPLLNVYGTQGSGKTSLVSQFAWPAFSGAMASKSDLLSIVTPYAVATDLASSNAIPLPFDEYRADLGATKLEWFRRYLRRSYTGETEGRGQGKGQSLSLLTLSAPVVILGEIKIEDDPALVERTLFVHPHKPWLAQHPESRKRFTEVTSLPLNHMGSLYQVWSLQADLDAMLKRATEDEARMHKSLPERVKKNIICALVGLEALTAFGLSVGVTLPPLPRAAFVNHLTSEILEIHADGSAAPARDSLDEAIGEYSLMAQLRRLKEGTHFAWIRKEQQTYLFLAPNLCEAERDAWARERGKPNSGSPGTKALVNIAREKESGSYVVDPDFRVALGNGRPRGFLVDPNKIMASLGIDDFPQEQIRTHGGRRIFPESESN